MDQRLFSDDHSALAQQNGGWDVTHPVDDKIGALGRARGSGLTYLAKCVIPAEMEIMPTGRGDHKKVKIQLLSFP
jgi:hypothetical protein